MAFRIIKGDLEPDLLLDLAVNGALEDINDATDPVMIWWKPDDTTDEVDLTVVDADAGRVRYTWVDGDTDLVGMHRGRVRLTRGNGEDQTFPSDGSWFRWRVYSDEPPVD